MTMINEDDDDDDEDNEDDRKSEMWYHVLRCLVLAEVGPNGDATCVGVDGEEDRRR